QAANAGGPGRLGHVRLSRSSLTQLTRRTIRANEPCAQQNGGHPAWVSPILHCSVTNPSRAGHRRGRMSLALGRPSGDRWRIRQRGLRVAAEREPPTRALALDVHDHDLTAAELAEENLLGERVLDLALDRPAQWPGTEHRIEAVFGGQLLRGLGQLQDRKSVV